jgi:hypothetical protein
MKVFYFFSVMDEYFHRLSVALTAQGESMQFAGMLYGLDQSDDLRKRGFPWQKVWTFTDYRADEPLDMSYLVECERRYAPPNLYCLIAGDRFLSGFPNHRALALLQRAFRMSEAALDEHRPDVIVSEAVSCMLSYALFLVARHRRIPFLSLVHSRIAGRMAVIQNAVDRFEKVEQIFEELKRRPLTGAERAEAEQFLVHFHTSKMKPDYMRPQYELRISSREDIQALLDMVRRYRRDPDNHLVTHPARALWTRGLRNVRYRINRRIFERPVANEKFVLFPLHFQPEASTLIRATFHLDQLSLIEDIAKSVPVDHKLYVKEHSVSVGRRPLAYYRRIKRIANVRLISPYVDSHELLRQTNAVLCITGTMGWEALLYEKPVITFGDACYNAFDLVHRIRDVRLLPEVLRMATAEGVPDRDLLLKFIISMFRGTYEGYRPSTDRYVLTDENIRRVARVVAAELKLLEPVGEGQSNRTAPRGNRPSIALDRIR